MTGRSRTDSATRPPLEGCDFVEPDLFVLRAIEVKRRRGNVRPFTACELACRWCNRRGYHLRGCPRAEHLRDVPELELRARYLLELVDTSSRTPRRPMA